LNRKSFLLVALSLLLSFSAAFARVSFGVHDFSVADFSNAAALKELCTPKATSFWCDNRGKKLKLVTSKGIDYIFSPSGEVLAYYYRAQRGQDFGGNYAFDGRQNLIPASSNIPGGAVLLNGKYQEPKNVKSSWTEKNYEGALALEGTFSYQVGNVQLEKTILVSSDHNSIEVSIAANRVAGTQSGAQKETLLQLAYPGIGKQATPVIKVGKGDTVTLSPGKPTTNPSYISLQANNRNTGTALVIRPNPDVNGAGGDALRATVLSGRQIALGKPLAAGADGEADLELQVYAGPNEMVHFLQEDYLELPGLFKPNILGRLSLGIIIVLRAIHGVVGSWGLSIILLTLMFRLLVWPLIHTQMKSMVGMQNIQPKIKELQTRYKDDREKLTQATMELYKEAGVNPAGGCLPAVVQMPIFIILWRVFINFEFNEGFLWIPDLGLNDPIYLLPILYVAIMVAQAVVSSKGNRQTLQQQLLISGVFVFFAFSFPAGVTLYLITSMLVQVTQQFLIQRSLASPTPVAATGLTPIPTPAAVKPSAANNGVNNAAKTNAKKNNSQKNTQAKAKPKKAKAK